MSDGDALLKAILANPDEDTPRLVYADWLEENGQGERAEFIRVQVACSHFTDCPVRLADVSRRRPVPLRCGVCEYCTARKRSEELSHRFPILPQSIPAYGFCLDPSPVDGDVPHGSGLTVVVARGFVLRVICAAADWCRHADAILAAHPVRRVVLTTLPEFDRGPPRGSLDRMFRLRGRREWVAVRLGEFIQPHLLPVEWPGIEFELPMPRNEQTPAGLEFLSAGTLRALEDLPPPA